MMNWKLKVEKHVTNSVAINYERTDAYPEFRGTVDVDLNYRKGLTFLKTPDKY